MMGNVTPWMARLKSRLRQDRRRLGFAALGLRRAGLTRKAQTRILEDVLSKGLLIDRSTRVPSTARASCQRPRIPYGRKRRRVLPVDRGGKAKMRLACQKTISREGRSSRLVVTARSQPRTGFEDRLGHRARAAPDPA